MQNPGPPEMGSPCLEPHHSSLGQAHTQVYTQAHVFTFWTSLRVPSFSQLPIVFSPCSTPSLILQTQPDL